MTQAAFSTLPDSSDLGLFEVYGTTSLEMLPQGHLKGLAGFPRAQNRYRDACFTALMSHL